MFQVYGLFLTVTEVKTSTLVSLPSKSLIQRTSDAKPCRKFPTEKSTSSRTNIICPCGYAIFDLFQTYRIDSADLIKKMRNIYDGIYQPSHLLSVVNPHIVSAIDCKALIRSSSYLFHRRNNGLSVNFPSAGPKGLLIMTWGNHRNDLKHIRAETSKFQFYYCWRIQQRNDKKKVQ